MKVGKGEMVGVGYGLGLCATVRASGPMFNSAVKVGACQVRVLVEEDLGGSMLGPRVQFAHVASYCTHAHQQGELLFPLRLHMQMKPKNNAPE